ncbi:hypothetical protein ADL00_33885 [Streptomyces sp. AS58]|nr:hypothetical protein ADL00_33885 [Streptomyces sp. AS58]
MAHTDQADDDDRELAACDEHGPGAQSACTAVTRNHLFHTTPITGQAWLRILGIAAVTALVVAADKRLHRPPM